MSKEFSPEEDDQMPEKKSSQQLLLLLLLLLIVTFAYLYFFTGMIRPRETPPAPQPAPQAMVKKPLPPRPEQKDVQPGTPDGKPAAAAKGAEKTAPPPPSAAAAPAAKPAPSAPEAKPAKPAVAASQAKPAAKPPAPAAAAPQANNAKPEAPAAKQAKAAATSPKQPAAKVAAEAKPAAKASGAASEKPKAAAKQAAPAYVLELKDDLLESEMGPVTAKLKRAGIGRVVKTRTQKGEPMHRLFLADFGNRDEALEELERLKFVSPDAFILKENGRHTVYAGSYLREAKATVEQNRLLAKGVKLLIRSAIAPVAIVKVRAGSFADRVSAEKAAKALKKGGLSAKVVKIGS